VTELPRSPASRQEAGFAGRTRETVFDFSPNIAKSSLK